VHRKANNTHRINHTHRRRVGFTLIELLVVIAIIAILAAILFPVFAQARDKARQSACLSNQKQIGLALMQYVQDFDETYPPAALMVPTVNGGGGDLRMPIDMQLQTYIKNDQIWSCPSDSERRVDASGVNFWDGSYRVKAILRSYSYIAEIYTVEGGTGSRDPNTGMSTFVSTVPLDSPNPARGKSLSEIDQTSDTLAIAEVWLSSNADPASNTYVGSPPGSVFTNCDAWKLAGRTPSSNTGANSLTPCGANTSKPTLGHNGGANYLAADGSAKFRTWGQVRANDFYLFKLRKPGTTVTP
jgi:prepilin-type N-terminal cleavage/methylation domain-containing protein/prepilin-type processing-associated H-X9-DG protein